MQTAPSPRHGRLSVRSARFTDQRLRRAVAKRFSHGRGANVELRLFRVLHRSNFRCTAEKYVTHLYIVQISSVNILTYPQLDV